MFVLYESWCVVRVQYGDITISRGPLILKRITHKDIGANALLGTIVYRLSCVYIVVEVWHVFVLFGLELVQSVSCETNTYIITKYTKI